MRSWAVAVVIWVSGFVVVAALALDGSWGLGAAEACAFLAVGAVMSPLVFPRPSSAAEAERRAAVEGRPVVYWRPGCRYCLRLRFRLGRDARSASWVNIWADPDGADAVRAVTGGDETVPTCVLAGEALVNPDPVVVRAACLAADRA